MMLLGALGTLWLMPVPRSPAQAPTEEELKDFERQVEQLEKKQAEAKRKADAAKKAAAAAEAKRGAARKKAEEEEDRRVAERRAGEAASALAGEFVDIPGGSFQMGCSPGDSDCEDTELPVHTVSIRPFRMGKYEVTVGQFKRFVEAAGYGTDAERGGGCETVQADGKWAEQAGRDWKDPGFPQTDRDPVVCVSWNDAKAYVQWLSRQGGGRYRLPSESEWEYAVRAGGSARYGFGDSEAMLCAYGNVADRTAQRQFSNWAVASCDDGALYTAPVGSYRANGFGLHDMHGNVWEWTEDCYNASYADAPSDGTAWTAGDCGRRVVRGGSWIFNPRYLRSAVRDGIPAGVAGINAGFRLARAL
jgi:formylglycine-generating enzyme required for sulfatase activity